MWHALQLKQNESTWNTELGLMNIFELPPPPPPPPTLTSSSFSSSSHSLSSQLLIWKTVSPFYTYYSCITLEVSCKTWWSFYCPSWDYSLKYLGSDTRFFSPILSYPIDQSLNHTWRRQWKRKEGRKRMKGRMKVRKRGRKEEGKERGRRGKGVREEWWLEKEKEGRKEVKKKETEIL